MDSSSYPIISLSLGVASYLQQNFELEQCRFSGASGGAWTGLLLASGYEIHRAVEAMLEISEKHFKNRFLGSYGVYFKAIRETFERLWGLGEEEPIEEASLLKSIHGRLGVAISKISLFTSPVVVGEVVEEWSCLDDLYRCILSSALVPFAITGLPVTSFRGSLTLDAGLTNVHGVNPNWVSEEELNELEPPLSPSSYWEDSPIFMDSWDDEETKLQPPEQQQEEDSLLQTSSSPPVASVDPTPFHDFAFGHLSESLLNVGRWPSLLYQTWDLSSLPLSSLFRRFISPHLPSISLLSPTSYFESYVSTVWKIPTSQEEEDGHPPPFQPSSSNTKPLPILSHDMEEEDSCLYISPWMWRTLPLSDYHLTSSTEKCRQLFNLGFQDAKDHHSQLASFFINVKL